MKRFLEFLLLLCAPISLFAQGAFIPPQTAFKNINGVVVPIANATVTVCGPNAAGIPCSPALTGTIFKDAALTQALPNPFTSDANGNYQFATAPATLTVTLTSPGYSGYSYQITVPASGVGDVTSVFGRTGAVTAHSGDYLLNQIGNPTSPVALTFGMNVFNLNFNPSGTITGMIPSYNTQIGNQTPATSSANVNSASIGEYGQIWNGTSAVDEWGRQIIYGTGTNPTSTYTFSHDPNGSTGLAAVSVPALIIQGSCSGEYAKADGTGCGTPAAGGGNPVISNCSPDGTGNSFYNVTTILNGIGANYPLAHWEFIHGTSATIFCTVYIPTAQTGATVVLDVMSNDTTPGHTATVFYADSNIVSGSYNSTTFSSAPTQTFTTSSSGFGAAQRMTFNVQSTLSNGTVLIIELNVNSSNPTSNILFANLNFVL
jgi:hypothetical protein